MKKFIAIFLTSFLFSCTNIYASDNVYIVKKGDTLWNISNKYQVKLSEIIYANPQFENPNLIYPEDEVYIPMPEIEETFKDSTKQTESNVSSNYNVNEAEKVVALVNEERNKNGLKPLKINNDVAMIAQYKCQDMNDNSYFGHTSPIYGSPYDMLKKFNVSYSKAGQNIANKQISAQQVMSEWMNSEGHRNNILSAKFTEIGVGYVKGNDTTYWTQIFIAP